MPRRSMTRSHCLAEPLRRLPFAAALPIVLPLALGTTNAHAQIAAYELPQVNTTQVDTQQAPPDEGLTGDWGGLRTRLRTRGVGIAAAYTSEIGTNVAGGDAERVREAGQIAFGVTVDTRRAFGLTGGKLQGTVTYRRGYGLDQAAGLNTLQRVHEISGRGNAVRLTEFWYEQSLAHGFVALKAGRLPVGNDSATFPCYFMNLSFCGAPPGNIVSSYWYNAPVGQWAVGARFRSRRLYVQAAVYEVNPRNLKSGLSLGHFHGATGVLRPVEIGWKPQFGSHGLVGSYKLGAWYSSVDGDDVLSDEAGGVAVVTGLPPRRRAGRSGYYLSAEQQVLGTAIDGKAASGVAVFLNYVHADSETSIVDSKIALGLFYRGFFASRPNDTIGFGVARTHVNGRAAQADALDPDASSIRHSEYASELYYGFHARRGLQIRPNVQWVHDAGGRRSAADIGVLGVKALVSL